ncbi:substrate-binding domain-containing protein [Paenibacillus thalictri]|uniref:GntR family transcriptional regulator n=1 Tax=Paenibacillus thalictri TaxID=2527873 RepID=A0A4Q9DLX9_9BACL|nr:GntR family transcriptional regulator [Paenibacillus thalictri]TBL73955.1 GntR family transcriptional regulator [Paenibacillus thalictri]
MYEDIKHRILEDIRHLPAHTRIPSRVDMMKRYGVTRTTIEKAISELAGSGYLYSVNGSGTYVAEEKPSEAGSPAGFSVRTWGVVLPSIMDDLYPEIVRAIEDAASSNDIHLVLCNTDHDVDKQHAYLEKLARSNVQGIVIVPAITKRSTANSFELLSSRGIPFVFCNRAVEGVEAPRVQANNFYGSYMATKYLIGLGKRRIGFIAAPIYTISEQRYQGFLGAMQEAALPVAPENVMLVDSFEQEQAGEACALNMLAGKERPDAIVCFNDSTAKGVYRAIEQQGLKVGKDVAVIGNGDTSLCDMLPVKLTSIRYPTYQTGAQAAGMLLRMMSGNKEGPAPSVILQPELIVRQSCGE